METKESLLYKIREAISARVITKEEVISAVSTVGQSETTGGVPEQKGSKLQQIFYYIGGIVVTIGVIVLVFNHWVSLSTTARIWVTLGVSIACYLISLSLLYAKQAKELSQVFHVIAAVLMPTGVGVLLYEIGHNFYGFENASIMFTVAYLAELVTYVIAKERISLFFSTIFGVIAFFALSGHNMLLAALLGVVLLATNLLFIYQAKKTVSVFLSILFGSMLYIHILNWIVQANNIINSEKIYEYSYLFFGIAIMIVAWVISQSIWKKINWFWYLVGSASFFGALFSLSGFKPDQNMFWTVVLALFVLLGMFVSVFIQSKTVLFVSAIALVSFVIKLTAEYFVDSLGWPLGLVIVGIVLMAMGYISVHLSRKYFGAQNQTPVV